MMKITKEFRFEAAHNLINYEGKCKNLHGHTYKLLVTLDYPVQENGLAFDFCELERIVRERIIRRLDHSYLNDLLSQSSAEYLAIWIWENLKELPLFEIKIFETPFSSVTYRGEEQHLFPKVLKEKDSL
ncbi:MAG: 6-carboxytetrahydropterin synthase QueD [Planctomycetota bacterium]|nr:MAG: 6-carboxytetrahydropterin synthase QueD [Planctomycetota bacterium]